MFYQVLISCFFTLIQYINTSEVCPNLTVSFPCSKPTLFPQMTMPVICRNLAPSSSMQIQALYEPRKIQGITRSRANVGAPTFASSECPLLCHKQQDVSACCKLPYLSASPQSERTSFHFLFLIIKRPEANFPSRDYEVVGTWSTVLLHFKKHGLQILVYRPLNSK